MWSFFFFYARMDKDFAALRNRSVFTVVEGATLLADFLKKKYKTTSKEKLQHI